MLDRYNGKVDLIILDVWGDVNSDINSNYKSRDNMQKLHELCTKYNVQVLIVHHTKKSAIIPHVDSIKGVSDFPQKTRMCSFLSDLKGYRYISCIKSNSIGDEMDKFSYRIDLDSETLELKRPEQSISTVENEAPPIKMETSDLIRRLNRNSDGQGRSQNASKGKIDYSKIEGLNNGNNLNKPELRDVIMEILETENKGTAYYRIRQAEEDGIIKDDGEGHYSYVE